MNIMNINISNKIIFNKKYFVGKVNKYVLN